MLAFVLNGSGHLRLLYNVVRVLLDAIRLRSLVEREFASSPALVALGKRTVVTVRMQRGMRMKPGNSGCSSGGIFQIIYPPKQKKFAIGYVIWITIFAIYIGRVQTVQMAIGWVQDV